MTHDTAGAAPHTGSNAQRGVPRWPLQVRCYRALLARLDHWLGVKLITIYQRPLLTPRAAPAIESDLAFRELAESELLSFADDRALALTHDFVRRASQSGDACFGILHGERLVSYRWYAFSGITPCEDGLSLSYAYPGRAYGYKAFTDPRYRGRHLQQVCTANVDPILIARGCTHVVGYIAPHNYSSLKAQARIRDVERLGLIAYTHAFGRALIVSSPNVRRHCIALRP